jgi:hypothetical protein
VTALTASAKPSSLRTIQLRTAALQINYLRALRPASGPVDVRHSHSGAASVCSEFCGQVQSSDGRFWGGRAHRHLRPAGLAAQYGAAGSSTESASAGGGPTLSLALNRTGRTGMPPKGCRATH